MAVFYVDEGSMPGRERASTGDVLDAVIGAAGGRALPGLLGVAQAIVTLLATPRHNVHPALHWTKVGLGAAGVVRAYQKASNPKSQEARKDPIDEWFRAHSMKVPAGLDRLSNMILSYSLGNKSEDICVGDKSQTDDWIRIFTLKSGLRYAFRMWHGTSYYGNADMGAGPYVSEADHDSFMSTIGDVVWSHSGDGDLQLTAVRPQHGAAVFSLSSIGEPDAYVGNEEGRLVDRAVDRCRAFRDRGVSRNILFYGPPGTGKTTLARSIARSVGNGRTLRVEAAALELAGVGAVMGFIRVLRPRVVLFDDMDRCMGSVVELLHALDQGHSLVDIGIMLIGTINVVSSVDPALLRPGRFDEVLEISEPGDAHRARIVAHYLRVYGVGLDVADALTELTAGFAPADVREVVQAVSVVGVEHLEEEIARVGRQRRLHAGDACVLYNARAAHNRSTRIPS